MRKYQREFNSNILEVTNEELNVIGTAMDYYAERKREEINGIGDRAIRQTTQTRICNVVELLKAMGQ